jgi:MinD superfamily P-loop ATPase
MKPELQQAEKVTTPVPEVDEAKCDYCGKCGEICQFSAITVISGVTVMTFPELCHSCKGCMMVCPTGAISETDREMGILESGFSTSVEFVHGRLRIGEAMSPPLISRVKDRIKPDKINIIDAPPGTSCPAIEALKDSDFAVMVTEPTPFGLNDLELAVGAARTLSVPVGIIINRCDVGDGRVKEYAKKEAIPVLMEIPNDRRIAEAYSCGVMIVDVKPEMKDIFRNCFEEIIELCNERISSH